MGHFAALPVAILLIITALVLFWLAGRQKQKSGLPGGKLIYVDTQEWRRVERPLYCPELFLHQYPQKDLAEEYLLQFLLFQQA